MEGREADWQYDPVSKREVGVTVEGAGSEICIFTHLHLESLEIFHHPAAVSLVTDASSTHK